VTADGTTADVPLSCNADDLGLQVIMVMQMILFKPNDITERSTLLLSCGHQHARAAANKNPRPMAALHCRGGGRTRKHKLKTP
jgi:hypothetical protein